MHHDAHSRFAAQTQLEQHGTATQTYTPWNARTWGVTNDTSNEDAEISYRPLRVWEYQRLRHYSNTELRPVTGDPGEESVELTMRDRVASWVNVETPANLYPGSVWSTGTGLEDTEDGRTQQEKGSPYKRAERRWYISSAALHARSSQWVPAHAITIALTTINSAYSVSLRGVQYCDELGVLVLGPGPERGIVPLVRCRVRVGDVPLPAREGHMVSLNRVVEASGDRSVAQRVLWDFHEPVASSAKASAELG
ncbi:hypothetical protein V8E53_001680 [Lactarius tabidus]